MFLLTLLSAVALPGAPIRAATPDGCAAAPAFSTPDEKLKHLAEAVRGQDTIDVLAVGSGTMVGQDGGGGNAFPYRMIQGLRSELPGREIELTLRGSRGATAGEMLKLIETELAEQHFALVLWQTGTVEALRSIPPEELRKVLEAGIEKVRASGADLVLIDAQYSKPMAAKVNELPYLEVLRKVAEEQGVVLFRRYDLMQSWAADGRNDLENVRKADREKVIDALHACLAQVLVKFVSRGAGIKAP
jgi:hypothetical protein